MQEQAVFGYFFPRKKVTRRKGHPFQGLCVTFGFLMEASNAGGAARPFSTGPAPRQGRSHKGEPRRS
ncbi:hypothetical protein J3B00_004658 [Pseudomonas sp. BP8]|nr:hypothetical protein [Pseudomonas sp. BP8]